MGIWRFVRNIFYRLKKKKRRPVRRRSQKPPRKKPVSPRTVSKRKKAADGKQSLRKPGNKAKKKKIKPSRKPASVKPKVRKSRQAAVKNKSPQKPRGKELGTVTHYFDRISVAAVKLKSALKIGDTIRFACKSGEFTQMVSSLQVDRKDILKAPAGKEVGLRVLKPVSVNDKVYLALES